MSQIIYTVTGMSCGHCVTSVTEELSAIDEVTGVAVDLPSGEVTVTTTTPVDEAAIRAAIVEAGYDLAS